MITNYFEARVQERIRESIAVKTALLVNEELISSITAVGLDLAEALRSGHRAFFFGNGGSAADAQHIAAELVGRYLVDRPPLPAVALTVNTSNLTAIANDYSFEAVFARQLEALGTSGDVAVGLSTSGNSRNVLLAIEVSKRKGISSVGLTGQEGGRLKDLADRCICVPSNDTPRVQEVHILIGHILSEIVETTLFDSENCRYDSKSVSAPTANQDTLV